MTSRRGVSGLSGVLVIDKPAGLTSHDVVARIRSATGEGRVGHAGTLDPMATGVLVVLVGSAARLERYLSAQRKSYQARIAFGASTDTLDAEGAIESTAPVPAPTFDRQHAETLLRGFVGQAMQVPPAYSAIKRDGVPAHRRMRAGESIEMQPRAIHIYEAVLDAADPDAGTWDVTVTVSKGTYIRSLARDIGEAAGTVAHLAGLRRVSSGTATLGMAITLEDAVAVARSGAVETLFVDPVTLVDLPTVTAPADIVSAGRPLPSELIGGPTTERVAVLVGERLGAVYRSAGDSLVPETVFSPGVSR